MKIIIKCGGLPLAIKVMGGLLSTRSQTEREWEAVLNHRAWSVSGLPDEMDSRIYLSYEDLSPQLKQCFLYCSLFPKGIGILQSEAVPMWIGEGFIQPHQGGSSSTHDDQLEEVAIKYYEELITRNLMEPTSMDKYKCRMHDVVHSFAQFMTREESLVVLDSMQVAGRIHNDTRLPAHRMFVGPRDLIPDEWAVLRMQVSLRTLIITSELKFGQRDLLTTFSKLRVLFIKGGDCESFMGSLCELRHLRYLRLEKTNISRLPEDIQRMKFLQHIIMPGSRNLETLPSSITRLVHLRGLSLSGANVNVVIPKGLGGLTNLRMLLGLPIHMDNIMDGGWCILEEIGPLSQLRKLGLCGLENVSAGSLAEKARISSKWHLNYLKLNWTNSGWTRLGDEIEEKQHQQLVAEEVLKKLCPPPLIQHLAIRGYFGRMLPNWMMVPAATGAFKSLMVLELEDLPCCTKLPDGLCTLPSLKTLAIKDAPAIKSIGSEFQKASSSHSVGPCVATATSAFFPNLATLHLEGLCEWEQWDWEDVTSSAMAMPALYGLMIKNCKLSHLPPGLANSNRHALRILGLCELTNLRYVENFPSVVELDVLDCPELKRISGLSKLHKIRTVHCPNVEILEGVPSLDRFVLEDTAMEALPGYLRAVSPRYLNLGCNKKLYESIYSGSSCERDKIEHIRKHYINYIK